MKLKLKLNLTLSRGAVPRGLLMLALLSPVAVVRPVHASVLAQDAGGRESTPRANSPQKKEQEQDENEEYLHSPMVAKLGGMMGMQVSTAATTFTVLNFVVLALAVGYGLFRALPALFRNRSAAIQKDLVNARTVTEESSARLNAVEDRLAQLDGQIDAMRRQATEELAREEERMQAAVAAEKSKIVAAAEQEIATATATAQRDIQKYAAELAISQAARKLVVTAETDRLLVQGFAHRLGAETPEAN